MPNPFVFEEPVPAEGLVDRDEEAHALRERLLEGRNTRLEAPRRFGKTSLLRKVLADVELQDMVAVYVNFYGVLTAADVATRIERAYGEQLDSGLKRWFSALLRTLRPTLKAGGGPLPASAEVRLDPPEAGLLDRLAVPRRLYERHGRRAAIVFDEFQDVLAAGEQVDKVIRSELEQHGQAAAYVFSGSRPGMMRALFSDPDRAFYAQAGLVELGPLGALDLGEFIGDQFERHGRDVGAGLGPLLDLAGGHPQRAMLLAYHLYERTPAGSAADAETWSRALADVFKQVDGEMHTTWRGFGASQQRLVSVIADGTIGLSTQAAYERYGLTKSGGHRTALEGLEGEGQIVRAGSSSGWQIVDPLFALWLRGGRAWPALA